jgi:hypothetical protein
MQFLIWKRGIFCKFKEIKGLSGGEHLFAAQTNLQIDAEIAKKSRFRTETITEAQWTSSSTFSMVNQWDCSWLQQ